MNILDRVENLGFDLNHSDDRITCLSYRDANWVEYKVVIRNDMFGCTDKELLRYLIHKVTEKAQERGRESMRSDIKSLLGINQEEE